MLEISKGIRVRGNKEPYPSRISSDPKPLPLAGKNN
jgi:hypothetical protein